MSAKYNVDVKINQKMIQNLCSENICLYFLSSVCATVDFCSLQFSRLLISAHVLQEDTCIFLYVSQVAELSCNNQQFPHEKLQLSKTDRSNPDSIMYSHFLNYYIIVLLYYCTIISLYYQINIFSLLYYCIIILLYYCIIIYIIILLDYYIII